MSPFDKLAEYLMKFPGIGPRQARRFVYFLLSRDENFLRELGYAIANLKKGVSQCISCYRFYENGVRMEICGICADPNRDEKILLVVEKDVDFENINKMGVHQGKFFILGGTLPLLEKDPSQKIRAKELFKKVEKEARDKKLDEVVLATSANPEGENTALYIKKILEPLSSEHSFRITFLGRGLSTGTEIEYSDSHTFKNAMEGRK